MATIHIRAKTEGRVKNDYYPTPPFVGYSIVKQLRILNIEPGQILEPCAGKGWLASGMGDQVTSYDLHTYLYDKTQPVTYGIDCLDHDYSKYDSVITNPPYADNIPEKIIRHWAASSCKTLALFLRHSYLQSTRRGKGLFQEVPPSYCMIYGRVNCDEAYWEKPIGGFIDYNVMVWNKTQSKPQTRLIWVDVKADYAEWAMRDRKLSF